MRLDRHILLLAVVAFVPRPSMASTTSTTPFTVHWTAPGDDGIVGRATVYDLRFSLLPLTQANFNQAGVISGMPAPAVSGTPQSFQVAGLTDGILYYLALKSADEAGNWSQISNVFTRPAVPAGVNPAMPALAFSSPWPNPAHDLVHWTYSLPYAAHLQVDVFDVGGRHVRTVASGDRAAGTGELLWDLNGDGGVRVGKGIYFVNARLGAASWTKRLVVV